MIVKYIVQPDEQLGKILFKLLTTTPKRAVFISAFASFQTILRIKDDIKELKDAGTEILFILGIDMGGTSKEVLEEILSWDINIRIVKNRIPGHTFHPKLYLFEWDNKGEIIIGSNNFTEGGFFNNYECAVQITYELPNDLKEFNNSSETLNRFINPEGEVVHPLTEDYLRDLIAQSWIPTEAEARSDRNASAMLNRQRRDHNVGQEPLFGAEHINPPPPLPAELLKRLVKRVRDKRREKIREKKETVKIPHPAIDDKEGDVLIIPAAFYMTLPTLQGENIPGEARIPLEAIELAKEFWGWPDEYKKDVSPRSGANRVYWNWRPLWRVWSVEAPEKIVTQEVRMYMYENSSDFRFYARPLVNAKGDVGDIIRIQRIAQLDAEYECTLARIGTAEYNEWIKYCTQPVSKSTRLFGYA